MVISRLPQGGGSSGEYIFHISTNEPELQTEEVIITNGNTVNKKVRLSGGKATIKTNEGGNYTFICGMAKFEGEYSYFGDYDVPLVLNTAYITIEGKVSLAPPMDDSYQAPEGYDKPNSVDNFTVRVLDTDMSEDEALIDIKSFADGDDTLSFVVDITQHTNVKVEFSSEDGFITPESKYYTLGRKDEKAETITWVEKYAVLEVQREDPELLAEDVYLRWTEGGAPKEIIHHAANLTDKSEFICKTQSTYKVECNEAKEDNIQITQSMLENTHIYGKTIKLSVQPIPLIPILTATNENVIYINQENPWMAFDGNDTTQSTQSRYLDVAIGYKFDNKVTVTSVLVKDVPNPIGDSKNLKVEYSDDGSTYTTIATIDRSAHKDGNMTYELPISHDTPHYYYRIFAPISNYQGFFTVQFYGRLG